MIGAYVRVSSRSQTHAMQRQAIEQEARREGDKIEVWYSEKRTATDLARPELERMRTAARAGQLRRLYVYKLDRLTRSGIRDTFEVCDELKRCECELVNIADGFRLSGPFADILLACLAWSAQLERLQINERIAAARDRVEAEGGRWGRPRSLTDEKIAALVERENKDESLRTISRAEKVPLTSVRRALLAAKQEREQKAAGMGQPAGTPHKLATDSPTKGKQ